MLIPPGDVELGAGAVGFRRHLDLEKASRAGILVVGLFDQAFRIRRFGVSWPAPQPGIDVDEGALSAVTSPTSAPIAECTLEADSGAWPQPTRRTAGAASKSDLKSRVMRT